MSERECPEVTPEALEWERQGKVGGGPEEPGGDAEISNWPGETAERGMRPPEPVPRELPDDAA